MIFEALCCAVLRYAVMIMLNCAVICWTVLRFTSLCCAALHCAALCSTLLCCPLLDTTVCAFLYSSVLCDLQCGTYSTCSTNLFQQPHQDISGQGPLVSLVQNNTAVSASFRRKEKRERDEDEWCAVRSGKRLSEHNTHSVSLVMRPCLSIIIQ
jgi:hypothetical protein